MGKWDAYRKAENEQARRMSGGLAGASLVALAILYDGGVEGFTEYAAFILLACAIPLLGCAGVLADLEQHHPQPPRMHWAFVLPILGWLSGFFGLLFLLSAAHPYIAIAFGAISTAAGTAVNRYRLTILHEKKMTELSDS